MFCYERVSVVLHDERRGSNVNDRTYVLDTLLEDSEEHCSIGAVSSTATTTVLLLVLRRLLAVLLARQTPCACKRLLATTTTVRRLTWGRGTVLTLLATISTLTLLAPIAALTLLAVTALTRLLLLTVALLLTVTLTCRLLVPLRTTITTLLLLAKLTLLLAWWGTRGCAVLLLLLAGRCTSGWRVLLPTCRSVEISSSAPASPPLQSQKSRGSNSPTAGHTGSWRLAVLSLALALRGRRVLTVLSTLLLSAVSTLLRLLLLAVSAWCSAPTPTSVRVGSSSALLRCRQFRCETHCWFLVTGLMSCVLLTVEDDAVGDGQSMIVDVEGQDTCSLQR